MICTPAGTGGNPLRVIFPHSGYRGARNREKFFPTSTLEIGGSTGERGGR